MYKPTSYLNLEVDAAHANPEDLAMLERVFGFIDPLTCEPAEELGLTLRLKCRNRPYWDARSEENNRVWNEIVGPYMKAKLDIILNVLEECNNKKYAHYAGGLHLDWIKLQMESHEIWIRLDHDASGKTYLPDAFDLLTTARNAMSASEVDSFVDDAHIGMTVCIPPRAVVDAHRKLRLKETAAWEAWEHAQSEGEESLPAPAPEPAPAIIHDTIELIMPDGRSTMSFDITTGTWLHVAE